MHEARVALGIICGAHGIRGQVKIKTYTASAHDIAAYGTLSDKAGNQYKLSITSVNKEIVIASIAGIIDRNASEKLRNVELFVARSALPEPEADEYYHSDLIGMPVVTPDKIPYGTLLAIHNHGAGDVVEVQLVDGSKELLAFTKATFPVINILAREIIIYPPEHIT